MSLHPQEVPSLPDETARVARAACPQGTLAMQLRDHLGAVYDDATFAPLFAVDGHPAEAPWRLALVTVLQFAAGLSDRQAAEAVRVRVDWTYALALDLTDQGFHYSVLCAFRTRLLSGGMEQVLLDALLRRCQEQGLLKARGRQRTDSTHVLAAIRMLNRLMCVGETLRHALNALATVAPTWLRALAPPEWFERYSLRFEESRLPTAKTARAELAAVIGADGFRLLQAVYAPDAPPHLRHVPAVDILRRVWLQQYHTPDSSGVRWREGDDVPPSAVLIHSPYDPEARYSTKGSTTWVGYKAHISETCDDDTPHLLTHVETTPATTPDVSTTEPVHQALAAKEMLPGIHIVDTGYIDSGLLVDSATTYGIDLLGPVVADDSWQARAAEGFDAAHFAVDWERRMVTCPRGQPSSKWVQTHDRHDNRVIHVECARRACLACPDRPRCTQSAREPRMVTFRPKEQHLAMQQARQRQTTEGFKEEYARRAGIEGTLSQGVRAFDLRRARYIGLARRLMHTFDEAEKDQIGDHWMQHRVRIGVRRESAPSVMRES